MKTIRVFWTLPDKRTDDQPLAVDDIQHVKVNISVDPVNLGWTHLNDIPPGVLELTVPDQEAATWHFQGIVIDKDGQPSETTEIQIVVSNAPPNGLESMEAEIL